jgi:hypothetical protein
MEKDEKQGELRPLAFWRRYGAPLGGVGGRITYRVADLIAWEQAQREKASSES